MDFRSRPTVQPQPAVDAQSLGCAVVGAGALAGRYLVDALRMAARPDGRAAMRVVGIYSGRVQHARRFAQANQIPHVFAELPELLEHRDVRCVYIGGHPRQHAEVALAALRWGKHVLCEPPLALQIEQAADVVEAARVRGLRLAVNYAWRAAAPVQQMAALLAGDTIGELLGGRIDNLTLLATEQQSWRLQPEGGGVLLDRSVHDVDLLRYLLNEEIAEVQAVESLRIFGQGRAAGAEEDVHLLLRLARSGAVIHAHDSFLLPHAESRIELYGAHGSLLAHGWNRVGAARLHLLRNRQVHEIPLPSGNPYTVAVTAFAAAVRGEGEPLADGVAGVYSLGVALAAAESIKRRRAVRLMSRPPGVPSWSAL